MSKSDSWGIEVGANALKAIRLRADGDEIEVADFDVMPFKPILTTPDINVDEAIQKQLEQFLQRHDTSKSNVVVSVPGHLAFARFAKLPPIEPKKIAEIVKYEAMQQIPFPIHEVEWDYQVFQDDDSPDVEVGIFAISKERVANFLVNYRTAGLNIDALTLSPLAAFNAISHDYDLKNAANGTIMLDVGTTSTDLIIIESGKVWLRTMAIGGNNFTEAIMKTFKLSFSKAEKLKKEAATNKHARHIFAAMRPVFADFVQEIQKSLGFYQQSHRDAELGRVICVGSTFRLPGLQKFLKQQLELEIIRPDGFKKLTVDGKNKAEVAASALNLATAYGCALQGMELEQVSANVLPESIIKQRMWSAKQPWIAAAAAVVVAATGLSWWNLNNARNSFQDKQTETNAVMQPVMTTATNQKREVTDQKQSDPRVRIENLQRVLDYRDVWPKLIEDVSLASMSLQPRPVLNTTDYKAIEAIARNKRRRIYIDSISAIYEVSTGETESEKGNPAEPLEMQRYDAAAAFGSGPLPTAQPGQPAAGTEGDAAQIEPPSFVITVKGSTPYTDEPTASFLDSNMIKWLKDNKDRPDRPYKIIEESVKIESLSRVTEDETEDGKDGNVEEGPTRTPRTGNGRVVPPAGGRVVPPAGGRVLPRFDGNRGEYPEGIPGQKMQIKGADELFPPRPMADESNVGDWEFVITWKAQLLSPAETRKREEVAKAKAAEKQAANAKQNTSSKEGQS